MPYQQQQQPVNIGSYDNSWGRVYNQHYDYNCSLSKMYPTSYNYNGFTDINTTNVNGSDTTSNNLTQQQRKASSIKEESKAPNLFESPNDAASSSFLRL